MLLGISSECGALLNAIPVETTKLSRMGFAPPSAFVKMDLLRRQAVLLTAVLPLPWGAALAASLPCTGLWELLIVVCTVFGRVIGFGRAKCA